ncbi:MAG: 5'-nucleotidase C-terminal domain-containing protein [Cryomorphaceae bacterium]|nr:5'-nucleotidase C-terminal domain-containing protein [Cryomorphaceae bacterium]
MNTDRREFLKKTGLLGAALALNPLHALGSLNENPPLPPSGSGGLDADEVEAVILQTTDVHCQIHPHDELFWEDGQMVFRKTGGYANLATCLKTERALHKHSFLIDTGDMFQGSELAVKTTGEAMIPILNALDYDLYLPGNWEVVYYKKMMQRLLGSLHAPKVCANMYHDLGEGMRGELVFPAYYIWTIGRIKIGFLGYTDPLVPLRQSPNYSKGIIYSKPEDNLAHYVDVLRNQENCAAVLVIAHLGLSQQIHLANLPEAEGVDYVLGGDTHERVRTPIQCAYAKVVEPGAFGSFVGKLKLRFKDGKLIEDRYDLIEVNAETLTADATIASLVKTIEAPFSGSINEVIGYSKVPLYRYFVIENTIDTMITDALRWRMPEVDLVLSNGFRFCPPRATPDHTGNIPITSGYLFDMLPVDSPVRTAEATGAQIKEWLEKELHNVFADKAIERFGGWVIKFNGMHVEFNAYAPKGKRVQTVRVGKKPLDMVRLYRMSACERDGDPMDMLCRIKGVKNASNQNFSLHDVLRDYLKAKGPVSPTVRGNAKVLDAPQTLLTQVTGVAYDFR